MNWGLHRDEQGVSVIIGAMLLILITLVAAASLAVIVSQAQKQAMDRQALQAAVSNENLKINGIELTKSLDMPGYADKVNVTVQNLNVDDSRLITVYFNDYPAKQYNISVIENGVEVIRGPYDIVNRYDVRGGGSVKLILNTSQLTGDFPNQVRIAKNHSLTIKVMTSYVNLFNATFNPPSPAISTSTESGIVNGVTKEYIVLDGSGSSDDRSIVNYYWTLYYLNNIIKNFTGKIVQFFPDSVGPFTVQLNVINDVGLEGTSNYTIFRNVNFNPQNLKITPGVDCTTRNETMYNGMQVIITNLMSNPVTFDLSDGISKMIVDNGTHTFTVDNLSLVMPDGSLSGGKTLISIDGSKSMTINVNFTNNCTTPFALNVSSPVTFKVITNNSNEFSQTIKPPNAIARVMVQSQNIGSTTRDYLQLDGSDSSGTGILYGWTWTITNATTKVIEGTTDKKVCPYTPKSNGPFDICLIVSDDTGLYGTASASVPVNLNFKDNPPTAIPLVSVQTQNLGMVQRDYLLLDGSGSTDDSGIKSWEWTIYDAKGTMPLPGNWSDTTNIKMFIKSGKVVQFYPYSTGPFNISLKVTDSSDQIDIADNITVPVDNNFNPPASISGVRDGNKLSVHVYDLQGNPVKDAVVNFVRQYDPAGTMTFTPYSNVTIDGGEANTTVSAGAIGTIRVVVNNLYRDISWS